jgi:hypothetical protein
LPSDAFKELANLLHEAGLKVCCCFLCKHDPVYGYCYACDCSNGQSIPSKHSEQERAKLLEAVTYWRNVAAGKFPGYSESLSDNGTTS